jgi:Fur family peroxide stress response transcriptional regulator
METRLTPHRQVVLDVIRSSTDHPTAREVYERSSRIAPRLSFATVYNSLKFLAEEGKVRLVRFGDEAVRYDPMTERHDHLVCRGCGAVHDAVGGRAPLLPEGFRLPEGFQVEDTSIQFNGLCGACRARGKGKVGRKRA